MPITFADAKLAPLGRMYMRPSWKRTSNPLSSMVETDIKFFRNPGTVHIPKPQWVTRLPLKRYCPSADYSDNSVISQLNLHRDSSLIELRETLMNTSHVC